MVTKGSPQELKLNQMPGEVLEIDCAEPDKAIQTLRELDIFAEVALYGALIHVVTTPDTTAEAQRPIIENALAQADIEFKTIERIAPSLEDVFIASVR